MTILDQLKMAGYSVSTEVNHVRLRWRGAGKPDPQVVRPLLDELRQCKSEVLATLRAEAQSPPAINPATFPAWATAEANRIAALPEAEQEQALAEFEAQCAEFDALPPQVKRQALAMAEPKSPPRRIDPFDPRCYPERGSPIVLDDLDRPGWYIARFCGNLHIVGRGKTQIEALDDLMRQKIP